tara:strand:- start:6798 stop:7685 length:888 start_codon:yes stop_codon:yes gene_type:complete
MFKINYYICVSKANKNIYKCIESILNQTKLSKTEIFIIINSKKNILNKKKILDLNKKDIKINFATERKIGIPFARNKCLEIMRSIRSDFTCLIDDDGILPKKWLSNMFKALEQTNSDIITGPQISKTKNIYEVVLERHAKHNSRVNWAATNNVFMKSNIISNVKFKFDKELKNLGCDDQLFFSQLNLQGYKIYWNKYSPVFENRDQLRSNFLWFIKRNARFGSSTKIIYTKLYGPLKYIFYIVPKFFIEFLKSLYYLILLPFNFKLNSLFVIQYFIRSFFTALSIFGVKVKEYET